MSRPTIVNRNWMFLQIGGRLFWDVIQTATSTCSYMRPCLDSWTGEVHSVRHMRFVFRSKGYICFALSRAKHFLNFKVWLLSANSSTPCIFAIATFNALGFPNCSAEHWATCSINSSFPGLVLVCSPLRYW